MRLPKLPNGVQRYIAAGDVPPELIEKVLTAFYTHRHYGADRDPQVLLAEPEIDRAREVGVLVEHIQRSLLPQLHHRLRGWPTPSSATAWSS